MKVIAIFAALFALALSAPAPQKTGDADAVIVKYDNNNIGVDGYNYAYETSNGISADESGELKNAGSENESIAVKGSFTYTSPDGSVYTVTYIADENGFQPQTNLNLKAGKK